MIVLDTNVLSELMRPAPSDSVRRWVAGQSAGELFITAITQAEILFGLALLPPGQRRTVMTATAEEMFREDFRDRILDFDTGSARHYASIAAARRRLGRPISEFDAQIAAIATSRSATVATRNIADFMDCGLALVDPWQH